MEKLNTFESFVGQASTNLGVTSGFRTSTTEVVDWCENKNPPSDDTLNAEIDRLKAEYDAQEYARNRQPLYPKIGDQLDDLYHAGAFSAEMTATLKKVKDDNPK